MDAGIIGLFVMILVWDTGAQLLLKLGLAAHGELPVYAWSPMAAYLKTIATEPLIWLALVFLILAFLTWLAIIARVELSKAHPATSFSYVTVTIASAVFLNESLNLTKVAGLFLIVLGVFLIA
ncbi:transporter [Novimethylophilus kurashikiensis]|uniref:Transporter n=1 Tax=Novimethylophilus kurashikiensis TaxID=1825523 RepID=A0A2R5FF00_9PROT|nr:EamA family transporter [Novimethylophilus kurashikiensis]GBG15908.1 transporter [Novimethylophilus kurashikiensis]